MIKAARQADRVGLGFRRPLHLRRAAPSPAQRLLRCFYLHKHPALNEKLSGPLSRDHDCRNTDVGRLTCRNSPDLLFARSAEVGEEEGREFEV